MTVLDARQSLTAVLELARCRPPRPPPTHRLPQSLPCLFATAVLASLAERQLAPEQPLVGGILVLLLGGWDRERERAYIYSVFFPFFFCKGNQKNPIHLALVTSFVEGGLYLLFFFLFFSFFFLGRGVMLFLPSSLL